MSDVQSQRDALNVLAMARVELDKLLMERSLATFIRGAWPIIEPTTPYVHSRHVEAITRALTDAFETPAARVIINIPPRMMKSICATVMFPCWVWTRKPSMRFIFDSYSAGLADKHSIDRRAILQSDWYQYRWGDRVQLAADQNRQDEYENTARGAMVATSINGTITGKGADIIIIDDPINPEQALSETERIRANREIDQVIATRLNDRSSGRVILVMQRLHIDDTTGHLESKSPGRWYKLALPMEAEVDEAVPIENGQTWLRKKGELLCPARFPQSAVDEIKNGGLTAYQYAGQYQVRPVPLGGGLFKEEHIRRYEYGAGGTIILHAAGGDKVIHRSDLKILQTIDLASSTKTSADYFVSLVAGHYDGMMLLLSIFRKRLEGPQQIPAAEAHYRAWKPALVGAESVAYQQTFVQYAADAGLPIVAVTPDKDKQSRALALAARYEAGKVFHPVSAPWLATFEAELVTFWSGEHDDQVDAAVYNYMLWYDRMRGFSIEDYRKVYGLKDKSRATLSTGDQR